MKKYGTAMAFSYSFLGTLNMCMMVAISWPLFIMRTGGSPVLFSPLKLNPKYALYLTGRLAHFLMVVVIMYYDHDDYIYDACYDYDDEDEDDVFHKWLRRMFLESSSDQETTHKTSGNFKQHSHRWCSM